MRILLAEDDKETAEFVRRGLGELGHNVVAVDNGADALHMLSTGAIRSCDPRPDAAAARRPVGASPRARRGHRGAGPAADRARPDRGPGRRARSGSRRLSGQAVRLFRAGGARSTRSAGPGRCTPLVARLEHRGIVMDLLRRKVQRDGVPIQLQPREIPATGRADARTPGGRHPHHVARTGLELSFRSADQHRRNAHQPPSLEAQRRRQARR